MRRTRHRRNRRLAGGARARPRRRGRRLLGRGGRQLPRRGPRTGRRAPVHAGWRATCSSTAHSAPARRGCTSPTPTTPTSCGNTYLDADAVEAHLGACTEAGHHRGLPRHRRCRGVAPSSTALDRVVERFGAPAVARCGHRLEHLEMVTAEQAGRLGAWGVIASVQPNFDALWGGQDGMYASRLGVDRARRAQSVRAVSIPRRATRLRFRHARHRHESVGDGARGDAPSDAGQRRVGPRGVRGGHPRGVAGGRGSRRDQRHAGARCARVLRRVGRARRRRRPRGRRACRRRRAVVHRSARQGACPAAARARRSTAHLSADGASGCRRSMADRKRGASWSRPTDDTDTFPAVATTTPRRSGRRRSSGPTDGRCAPPSRRRAPIGCRRPPPRRPPPVGPRRIGARTLAGAGTAGVAAHARRSPPGCFCAPAFRRSAGGTCRSSRSHCLAWVLTAGIHHAGRRIRLRIPVRVGLLRSVAAVDQRVRRAGSLAGAVGDGGDLPGGLRSARGRRAPAARMAGVVRRRVDRWPSG